MNRSRLSLAVGVLAVGGLLFTATPASAAVAVLPEQDDLYGIAFSENQSFDPLQLVSFDPTNANATTVGTGTEIVEFNDQGQAAYDVSRDVSWITYVTYDELEESHFFLASIDVATGVTTTIGEMLDSEGTNFYFNGIMVGADGVLYAIDDSDYDLWTIDPVTAVATFVADVGHFHAFAYDPVTDAFYGIDHDNYTLWQIDVATGALTEVATWEEFAPDGASDSHSMQFDSNGVLWFQTWIEEESEVIATYTLGGAFAEIVGEPNVGGSPIYVDPSILITRGVAVAPVEPTLAATGSDAGPVVLFGGLLLAGGAALVLGRVASRRNPA